MLLHRRWVFKSLYTLQGVDNTNAYIASQAPLPNTVNDFWRMIWETDVKVILMACNETEGNKVGV